MAKISSAVRDLLAEHISSVAQLELLLFMRMEPERWWTADSLSQEMRAERVWLEETLKNLCGRGLCEESPEGDGRFRFRLRTPALDGALTALADAYVAHRVSVTELIHKKPISAPRVLPDSPTA